jgi:hypothetical protein
VKGRSSQYRQRRGKLQANGFPLAIFTESGFPRIGLTAALLGILVTHVLVHGPVQSFDRGVDVWFAAHRTGTWNTITDVSTILAQTQTVIAVSAVVVLLLR